MQELRFSVAPPRFEALKRRREKTGADASLSPRRLQSSAETFVHLGVLGRAASGPQPYGLMIPMRLVSSDRLWHRYAASNLTMACQNRRSEPGLASCEVDVAIP